MNRNRARLFLNLLEAVSLIVVTLALYKMAGG
jgi:hypothetical protein